ncbi:hypothetical protein BDZ90DRAFT_233830 [Jaminaea rosea]|uniref:Uncharacterized protein n=1 Tax=Jaminaea rosea TaxID=1569628 RepID=A0A316UKL9_9BASI|nr:hypothetical protein BDZ90DRAFT_233830 [Jaminaea rosea]PWN25816.1 hypothetical protein BDZ90DRAFT_233830 [Jaminaea rosea]
MTWTQQPDNVESHHHYPSSSQAMDLLNPRHHFSSSSRHRRNSTSAASASTSPSPRLRHSPLLSQGNVSDSTDSILTDPSAAHQQHRLRKSKSKSRLLSKQRSSGELSTKSASAAAAAAVTGNGGSPALEGGHTLAKSRSGSFFGLLRPVSSKQRMNASWIPTEPMPQLQAVHGVENANVNGSKARQPSELVASRQPATDVASNGAQGLIPLPSFEGIGSFDVSHWSQPDAVSNEQTQSTSSTMPTSSKPSIARSQAMARDTSSNLDIPSDGPPGSAMYATAPPSIAGTDTPSGHDSPALDAERKINSASASRGPSFADDTPRPAQASDEDARDAGPSSNARVWQRAVSQEAATTAAGIHSGEPSSSLSGSGSVATPSTSLKEIRRKAAQRASALPALDVSAADGIAVPASSSLGVSSSPSRARYSGLSPRSAGGGNMLGDESDGDEANRELMDEDLEDDLPNTRRARRNDRRMTMMDFLSAEPPASSSAPAPRSASGPTLSVARGAAGGPSSLVVPGPSSSPNRPRPRPVSMVASSPVRERDASPSGGGAGMSAMEFLAATEPPTATAASHDSPLESRQSAADQLRAIAKAQEKEARRKKREEQRAREVTLSIDPMVDTVNMFGSTQTSANYSLSGHVLVTVPRPQRSADPSRPVTVKSLTLTFSGFSTYADLSGRYSGIKLCEVPQELLADDATLPLASDLEADETTSNEPLRYKIQFDLNIPGWLPGSAYSRFGATFYCVGASAVVLNAQGAPSTVTTERHNLTAEPESMMVGEHGELLPTTSSPTQHVQQLPDLDLGGSSSQRNRGRESWLSKRAKQLSLKARTSSTSANESGEQQRNVSGGSLVPPHRPSLSARLDGGGTKRQADGTLLVKSNKYLIVVRRCRDVIPVPVARLAVVGDSLPAGAQDPPPARQQAESQQPPQPVREQRELPPVPEATPAPASTTLGPAVVAQSTPTFSSTSTPAMAPAIEPAAAPTTVSAPQPAVPDRAPPAPLPIAPSALNGPTDPSKQAMAARHPPPPPVRTSSAMGATHEFGAQPGSNTDNAASSTNNGAPPMRHFLHRPILHPPIDSGIEEGDGLPFSLTISVPSHIQVQNAEILTFGIQVEVGRTPGWTKVRELGGLRLRDMELMCTQSERHTSVPSRTFCATFPVPPEPKIKAVELPVLPAYTPPMGNRPVESSQEVRVRSAYDPEPMRSHLALLDSGRRLTSEENDVERVRSNVVGPPPSFQQKDKEREGQQGTSAEAGDRKGKGKEKGNRRKSLVPVGGNNGSGSGSAGPSRTHGGVATPPPPVPPLPTAVEQTSSSSSAAASQSTASTIRSEGLQTQQRELFADAQGRRGSSSIVRGASPSRAPAAEGPAPALAQPQSSSLPLAPAGAPTPRRPSGPPLAIPQVTTASGAVLQSSAPLSASVSVGNGSSSSSNSPTTPRRTGRGRRAYEAAVRGLSTFATAVMEGGYEEGASGNAGNGSGPNGSAVIGSNGGIGGGLDQLDVDQPRATYNFSGDDSHGVDLTKGRIRMTVNLPLVPSSASAARREGTPQLLSDYESPHMRIRHKLKVKLGFGFGAKPLGGEGEWGQALVMCVPVRFTEAPPREVREQFAPMPITVTTSGQDSEDGGPGRTTLQPPMISMGAPGDAPVLPAYTQLFRDDGSRLNEAEDLPAYPGPRQAIPAPAAAVPAGGRPALPHRGSVTGPMTPRLGTRVASLGDLTAAAATASSSAAMPQSPGPSAVIAGFNSLAPESVVDEAIRGITDPDESLAAMREQERELRELSAGEEEDGEDDDAENREEVAVARPQRPTLGSRAPTTLVEMGTASNVGFASAAEDGGNGDAGDDTVIVGEAGHEDEDRVREMEEELGI